MKTTQSIREYQRKYYLEKVKKKSEKKQEVTFQIQKRINGEWVTMISITKE